MGHNSGYPETTVQFVVESLSLLTGKSPLEVTRLLLRESRLIGAAVRQAAVEFHLQPHVWDQQLMDFYVSTDAFLFETVTWNFTRMKGDMRRFVVSQLTRSLSPKSQVLCFGDGMGFDSDAISRAGFDVTCFEVSGPCLKFAEELFRRNQSSARIETDFQVLQNRKFDAIVCLDVLEHVPNPATLVQEFHQWLNDDGLFLVHAPYYHVDQTRPTHLESNRQYAGQIESLYEQAGFSLKAIGGLLLDPLVFAKNPSSRSRAPMVKKVIGQAMTTLSRHVRLIPSLMAPLFTRPHPAWRTELQQVHASHQNECLI